MTSAAREQPGRGVGPSRGRGQRAQSQNTRHDLSNIVIGWHEAFGVQLAERDMQRPLIGPQLPQTVPRQIDALADADPGGASEQQRIGRQVVDAAELLLEQ